MQSNILALNCTTHTQNTLTPTATQHDDPCGDSSCGPLLWRDLIGNSVKSAYKLSKLIERLLFPLKRVTHMHTHRHTQASTHKNKTTFIAMTDVPFKRPRIDEGAGGSLMSHSAAGETIHYQLIYPLELFVLENSIMVKESVNSNRLHVWPWTLFDITCNNMTGSDICVYNYTLSSWFTHHVIIYCSQTLQLLSATFLHIIFQHHAFY